MAHKDTTVATWQALVERTLKGQPIEAALCTPLPEGFSLQPLYIHSTPTGAAALMGWGAWDRRQIFAHPDLTQGNREILADLDGGVTSLLIRFDAAARLGFDADHPDGHDLAGRDGVMVATADDLDTLLAGVDLDRVAVALDAGAGGVAAAALMGEVWKKRGAFAQGAFNLDPFKTLAQTGWLPGGLSQALSDMAAVALRTQRDFKGVTAVGVDTTPLYAAGADEALDLGAAMATGVAYLRAMIAVGLSLDEAARHMAFTLAVGSDQFIGMAKLRAARLLWARVLEACGASERRMTLVAQVAERGLTQRDPWVNLLRVTMGVFTAAVAGADSITAAPFDSAVGLATADGRRLARNTHSILAEEAHLAKVRDPAAGSHAIETLTHDLAARAWGEFQALEAAGGMAQALLSGHLRERLAGLWGDRQSEVAHRRTAILGVSEFPNVAEAPLSIPPSDWHSLRRGAVARLKKVKRDQRIESLDDVFAHAGVSSLGVLSQGRGGVATVVQPIKPHRLAEDFEALRDAADVALVLNGERPTVFLLAIGPLAEHAARLAYARGVFEAGGFEPVVAVAPDESAAEAAVWAFTNAGAAIACLCGADSRYDLMVESIAQALKGAGATRVYLAGKPSPTLPSVDEFLSHGCNTLLLLQAAHRYAGIA